MSLITRQNHTAHVCRALLRCTSIVVLLAAVCASAASANVKISTLAAGATAFEEKLNAGDVTADTWFGAAVALDGDTVAVGAPFNASAEAGFGTGIVYIFARNGTTWSQQARLVANDSAVGDQFGATVALDGDTLIIGAPFADSKAGADAGTVYIFERDGTTWSEHSRITAQDAAAGSRFGATVALDGDRMAVGAPFADEEAGADAGAVYVIARGDGSWSEQTRITAQATAPGDQFGSALSLRGDLLLIGAPLHDTNTGVDAGAAYIFANMDGAWHEQTTLTPSTAEAKDQFGAAVALDGDRVAVSAPQHSTSGGVEAGAVYVFARDGSGWTQHAQIVASDGAASDQFGTALALDGDVLAVGTRFKNTPAGVAAGSTYLFARSAAGWSEQQQIVANDAAAGDQCGAAVALQGNTLVAGAPLADKAEQRDAGTAYIWRLAFTITSVTSSPNPSRASQTVTLEATVAPVPPAAATPTGSVTFYAGLTNLGAALLDSNGHATPVTPDLLTGSNPIVAVYSGDDNLFASTSPVLLHIVGATIQWSTLRPQIAESAGAATIRVSLSGPITQAVTVDYATSDGSATAGSDYAATSGTLTIPVGQGSASFDIPILNDHNVEADETVLLTLSNPQGADLGAPATTTLTIRDDDRSVGYRTFLPMSMLSGQPDLVITQISLEPDKQTFAAGEPVVIIVVVENRGTAFAPPFWVDAYINPSHPPSANQIWNDLCTLSPCYGIAWGVQPGLAPGQRITLTSTPASYAAPYTRWPGSFAAGTTDVYVLADSWNRGVSTGAVAESDETNNRADIHGLTVAGSNPRQMGLRRAVVPLHRPMP